MATIMVPDPRLRPFQAVLVSPLGSQVEEVVGGVQEVDPPRVARVGVKDGAPAVLVERAHSLTVRHIHFRFRKVVEHRSTPGFLRGEGRLIVVVEISRERGHPLEAPSHSLLERLDLGQRCPRDDDEAHVAVIEMNVDAAEIVGPERTVRTPLVPVRAEHEVVDDELAPFPEELDEGLLAAGLVEDIGLLDPLPRELAALPVQVVTQPREFLFSRQERRSRRQPFFVRNHLVILDAAPTVLSHAPTSRRPVRWPSLNIAPVTCSSDPPTCPGCLPSRGDV